MIGVGTRRRWRGRGVRSNWRLARRTWRHCVRSRGRERSRQVAGSGHVVQHPQRAGDKAAQSPLLPGTPRPQFKQKMAEVLCVYREVKLIKEAAAAANEQLSDAVAIVSYDEKPGSRPRPRTCRPSPASTPDSEPNLDRSCASRVVRAPSRNSWSPEAGRKGQRTGQCRPTIRDPRGTPTGSGGACSAPLENRSAR